MAFEKFKNFMGLSDEDFELTDEEIEEEKERMREEESASDKGGFKPFTVRTRNCRCNCKNK